MMKLNRQQVEHIALLARLGLTQAEIEKFQLQLSHILENFEVLERVDTNNVPPTAQSVTLRNVMREDLVKDSYSPQQVLANAPLQEDGCFKVRAVLEEL